MLRIGTGAQNVSVGSANARPMVAPHTANLEGVHSSRARCAAGMISRTVNVGPGRVILS